MAAAEGRCYSPAGMMRRIETNAAAPPPASPLRDAGVVLRLALWRVWEVVRRRPALRSAARRALWPLRFLLAPPHDSGALYRQWIERHDRLGEADRAAIRARIASMPERPLFSVVMPVYRPRPEQLRAAIRSVQAQLWPEWELCIADDATPGPEARAALAEFAADPRIRIAWRKENGHIAAATNTALGLARGEWVALMDQDDLLPEHALYEVAEEILAHPEAEVIYTDEDKLDEAGQRYGPYFKPDFDPDLLLAQNLVSHLGVYRRALLQRIGGLRSGFEGSQDHDLALRAIAACGRARVRHIPAVLYHWRQAEQGSFSERHLLVCAESSRRAVAEHLAGQGIVAEVRPDGRTPAYSRVIWPLPDPAPLVSVVIPTRDRAALLAACTEGLLRRTDYPALELLVVDNGSTEAEALALMERLAADPRVRVLREPGPFNYSRLNNRAAAAARGEVLLLLNNDIEVIHPDWLREMVSHAVRPDVGAVGARLLYADGTVQHGGVVLGMGGVAAHIGMGAARDDPGYFGHLAVVREVGAVTGACLALRREVFEAVGGLDEEELAVAFNDVDLCLRIRARGLRILWTPFAELYHLESASRGSDEERAKRRRFLGEVAAMQRRWGEALRCDPFWSPNLSLSDPLWSPAFPPRRTPPWRAAPVGAGRGRAVFAAKEG